MRSSKLVTCTYKACTRSFVNLCFFFGWNLCSIDSIAIVIAVAVAVVFIFIVDDW